MECVARIVTRPSAGVDSLPDLIIGACFKNQSALKSGRVYEIREFDGMLMLVDIGPSSIGVTQEDTMQSVCWGNSVDYILDVDGNKHILTQDEYRDYIARQKEQP